MHQVRLCLDCEKEIRGRTDKKFCDDQCRSNFNNQRQSRSTLLIRHIDSILKRNRKIMLDLNPDGKARLSRSKLTAKGFDFNYFTNLYTTLSGKVYYFCYETGYLLIENDEVLLVRKDEKPSEGRGAS